MFDERDRKYFYDEFKNNGYEVGSYDDFKNDLNNKEDRDWYYNEAKNMGYDVGTQSDFDKMVMEPAASASSDSKQVAASATPQSAGQGASAEGKQQVAQPVAKPAAEKPKEDNRSWLTKWMTGTLPEEEEQETADKKPGLIAKALNMFPTGVQTSNGTYQPAPAIPQPTVKGEEMPVEVETTPSSANVASPESKEEVPASAAVVNNEGLMDAKLANYIENWKQRPDKEGDYFENMVADLLADGTANSNEEAVSMVKSALGRYANRSAMDVTNQVVSSLPDDTVQDAEKSIEAQWYSHGVQDKLKQEADNMGISYDDYVGLFLKPAMVQSLVNKYGPNYRDIAEGIATRLYSHDEHVQDRLMNQDINDAFSSVINKYVNPSVVDEYNKAQEAGSKAFTEGMEGSQFIPANLRLGTALGAQFEANEAKDPAKVLSGLQKKFGKLYRNPEFLNDMSNAAFKVMQRYGLNDTLGSDPKQFKPMINSVLKNELDQLEIKGMMPKGSAEYIMKTGLGNTIVGKITRKAVQTDYQNWLEDIANQQYQPGFWENVASGALTFAGDAWSYWLPGAAGGKLTKSMLAKAEGRLAGDLMAKGMERRVAERAAKVLIGKSKAAALKNGAVHGAVTFGGQSAISKPIDEVYRTGQFEENGKVYNPSVGKIIADTLGEVTKQSAVGAIMQGGTIANMIGRGLATNILADIGGKVADSGIMTGHQILERMAQDPNFKPTGKDAAESFLESMANLTAIGLPGMVGKYARFKDAREFNKKFDFTDQDIAELKRFGYEDLRDAFEKVGIGEYAVAGENAQRLDGQLTQKYMTLMNDKSVPEVLKAKMMAVVEGKRPSSFSPVVDSIIVQPMDHDGKVYLETLNKDGGIIDRKEFSSLDEAQKADKKLEYEKTLGLASVLEGEFHNEFTQEHLDGLYNKAAQKYNMGEKLTDEDKAAVYLHQNAGAIKEIMDKQQKGVILTDEEQKQVNAYRHYYDSALENSSVMREFVNTFEDSHGVARGTLRKALESKDKKYAPLVESYLMELYNSIELKREMKQTMDDLYNTAHGNEQKRIEGENPVSPAEGSAGGLEPPVSEGPAPYQDRTNSVSTPSDAEVAANAANVASSAAGGAGNETKVASSENKVANSDAFVMGQEAYKNGDSEALQAIDYNSDLATGRLKRAFKDSDNMFDLVTKVYNEGRDMEQFLSQRASLLTSAQKEAISKYVEAMDAKKGAIDALQHADDGYSEALKQQLWPYQTEDGNIVPATLTSGRQVFLKKANEYGGGFVVVPDELGQPTIKQVSDAEIKEVGTPVSLDEYIESSLSQQKEARAQQFISQFDGSGLKPNDRVAVAMEEGDENIVMTFAGYSEDGKIVLSDGKDNIALSKEEFDSWRTNALNNTINERLDREDEERELAEMKKAEAEKQERYKKGIFGYAAGQPDYSDAQTDPKVAAEYLQETAGDDRKALFANIVAEKQALQKRINQLREHIASNEEWLSINADLDPKNAETRTLANKQMVGQIADLQARFDNWNKIRSSVMTPEEAQAIKADRTQKIADAGVNEGDVAPIEGREVAVLSDEELKKQYPTMDEANDFIASERKRIYRIQSDEVQREIDGVDEVLDRYVNGEIDLEPEQIKELNTTKAQLQARQANLTESAKELKAQADKLNTLYRKENMEARAKVVENLTPAEQRAIKVENAIKNGNMSQLNAIYDEVRGAIDFNDTEPNTLEEYVANSIGRFTLNYEGKEKGGAFSNGIQQETGLGRKDFDKLQILAKEGEGKTVPEFVHSLYDDMPKNLKQMGYTDQDIRSAFLDLIGSAQSYSDIKNYTLNNKVANVEQQMREVERQEEEMMQDGAHSEAFDKIVELAKEQKEYWDLMEEGEVDPDDVPEVDVAHDMDELLKTLSDEEFKEVSDVLKGIDEEFEYFTANEYERREGANERKEKAENANTYDESIKEALKPVSPFAIALKSAVESGDKKAIKQAQKELTDALIASDLGHGYLAGQLAAGKMVKKKDELYKVKRATVKPITEAMNAIESALDSAMKDAGLDGVHVDFDQNGDGWIYADKDSPWNSRLEALDNNFRNISQRNGKNPVSVLPQITLDNVAKVAGIIKSQIEEGEKYNSDENSDVDIKNAPFADRLKNAIAETETEPTEAQKKAGNYKKGHLTFEGYDFTIETPKGVTRSGKDEQGKPWSVTMHDTYGYILGKIGVDGDHIDMFINDAADLDTFDGNVCVVDQVNPETGEFDEHKVMYGYPDEAAATKAYLSNYSKGWKGLGKITSVPKATFDKWLESSDRKTKPFADYAMIQHAEAQKAKETDETLPFGASMSMDNLPFHRDVKEVKPSEMTEAQKVAYDAVSTMLKKAGIPVKVVSNEDMEKVAEAQDNLNLAMLLNQPEMRFKIKTPEEKQAAENAYNFAKELRPDKWKQYAVVDMSNPNKMPEYFEKQELARKERSYYNLLMWGNYKVFNLDKSFEDNVAGLTGSFPSEFDPYKIDAQTSKKNELKKQMKEIEDAYNSTGQERNKYQIQLMKEYMDEHGLASENDIPDDVWSELDNKAHEKYQDKLDSLFAKYKDLDRQLKAIVQPGVRFLRTYHGTGASFDKFDLSHALEGEGSESFGHGVYVTNSSKIGREYAQRAKQRKMEDLYKNMRYPDGVKGDIFKRRVFGEMVNDVATGGSVASAKEFAKKRVGADANDVERTLENLKDREKGTEYEQNLKNRLAEYKEGLKWIDSLDEDYLTQGNANRYDVDIPDDNGSNYLDWEGMIPDSLDKQKVAEDAYKVVSDNQGFNDFKATPLNDFIAHTLKTYVNTTDVAGRVEKLKSDIKDVIENYVADDDVLALNEYLKDATPDDVLATIWYNDLVRDIKDADLGEELYRKLSTYVGDNAASQILSDNGLVGIKYPAGMIHGGAKEGDYNYVIFDENNANIVGNTKFAQGKGVVYGYTDGKEIVLNQDHLNANTPIHEYQHLWRTAAKRMNPELIAHGDELIKQTQLFRDLKEDHNYKRLSDDEICDEAFARLTGEDGAAILEQMAKEAIKENPLDTAKELTIISRLKNWLKKFWYWTLDTFTKWKPEDIKKMTLEDIRNLVLRDLAQGVDPRTVQKEKKEGAKLSKKEKDDATERIDKRIAELNRQEKEQSLKSENGNLAESHDNGYLPSKDNLDGVQSVAPSSAKIDKKFPPKTFYLGNLANFITSMGKNADITAGNFTKKLFEGMGMTPHGKDTQVSEYFKYQTDDGGKTTVRLSDHSGNALSIIKKGGRADKGYSIVVRVDSSPKTKFKANKYSNVAEYVYENPNADGLKDIARSVFNLIDTGEYLDLAGANEVHISPRNNNSETAKGNGGNLSVEDKIKAVSQQFGVDEADVAMYANAVKKGSTAEAARARANIKRHLLQVNEGNIFSLKDVVKYTKPINEALKENFGDLDAMIEERVKQVEAQRNAMEAARKRAEEEEAKRQKHLEELSLIPDDQLDKQYMDALAKGDDATAREMLDEAARRKGYDDTESAYQGVGAWAAPGNPGYESDKARRDDWESSGSDVNLEDMALGYTPQPDDYFSHPERYSQNTPHGLESVKAINTAIDAIKNGEKDVKVKVYRAVPTSVKEGKLRNGDWVTPSKKYAEMHGTNRLEGKYRIIEDEVPANQLWWDGNDANEFGFDDGKVYKYKNAKNNRKLNDLVTYDDKGDVIPPSKRFNSRKSDIRFMFAGEKGAAEADKAEEKTYRMDNLKVAEKMERGKKDAKAIKLATGWERGADGKWRYEMPDAKIKDMKDIGGGNIVKRFDDDMLWNDGKLADVIDAPGLFEAYPQLKDVRIDTDAIMNDMPSNGVYNAKTNTITIHADDLKYMNSILNHEIQHAIQYIEGFGKGGSPEQMEKEFKAAQDEWKARAYAHELEEKAKEMRGEYNQSEVEKALVEEYKDLDMSDELPDKETRIKGFNYFARGYADRSMDDAIKRFRLNESTRSDFDSYKEYLKLAGEVESRNVQNRLGMTDEERRNSLAEETEDVNRDEQIVMNGNDASYSIVKDPETIKKLDKEDTVKVYRAMQVGEDGKLYPPMAAKVKGKFVEPIELGKWEQADERPELADDKGMFTLNKGNGKSLKAAYNPYLHTSRTPLNDQFSEAQNRPNIVTVEVEVPKSELTSGYKADKAKDAVGEVEWKAGIIQGQLTGKRKVVLSRWDKPVRIVPDSEVADVIVNDMFKGKNITMPSNVVTPSLRKELEKRGVPFVETDNRGRIVGGENDGVHYSKVYGKKANVKYRFGDSYDYEKYPLGRVEPNLANKDVKIVHADANHGFKNFKEARNWAKKNIVKIYTEEETGGKGLVRISNTALDKYLSQKAVDKSDSQDVHLAVLKVLPSVLKESIDAETHPDFIKGADGERRTDNGINKDLLVHRCYGAVNIDGKIYRVKITLKEEARNKDLPHKAYSYEATKIELLAGTLVKPEGDNPNTNSSQMEPLEAIDAQVQDHGSHSNDSISGANLLKNVEMSYDKGKKLLDESEKMGILSENQRKVADSVVNTANKLGGAEATVYSSLDDVPEEYRSEVELGAKGWYDPETHTVHVYLPNCADANEAERTVLHEKIGHEGMEVLLGGEDEVRKFANFVYNSVAASTRGKILEIANEYDPGWKKHDRMNVGTQEYIARLAEEGPKTAEDFSLWTKIKHYLIKVLKKLGIRVPGLLNDKDLRYYLMKAGKALHVWDDMPEAQQEAMMKQASNAEIKDSLGEGAGQGKPRQKKGESMIQYMKRVQEWRKWKDAREDENDPEPPMFYDIDKDEAGKKEWELLNKEWRDRHHLAGEEPTGMPIRMKGETDDAYMTRIHDYEKWKDAMKDEEDPIPDMFDFEKSKQEEVKRKYEDWLARHELLEQQQADLDLYEGKIYPAETNPKADDLEQKVMQDLAEVTSTDVSKEGAAKTVKHAVIHRRKNMEEASADDAIYINDVKNRIEKMADSGVFDKLLSDYKGKANRAEKLAEAIPYIIEAPRRLRDLAHDLNATGAFDKGHIHIQPEDVEAIQPYVADLIAETAKQHSELKDDKEVVVYDDPLAVGEVASKMAQAINNNHQGKEGFVPIDGSDIMSEHVLPLVMQQIVPDGIDYKNLSPEMKAALDSIRDWYNYTYDWLKDNRTLKEDTGYSADYVNHIWDKEKSDKQAYAMYVENRQRTKSPNEKPRTISTLMEGISVGLVPKTTDITKMMAYYSRSNIEAWVNKTMLQELSGLNVIERNEDGVVVSTDPLLSSTPPFNLEQYKYFEIPGVGPVWVYNVSTKQVTVKNPITGKDKVLYSEASAGDRFGVVFETYQSSPFWKAFDTLASSAKKLELGFSGFHAGALTEVYMVQNMVEFGPKKAMANFMKYIFADTMKNHELPCFANPEDFQEAASHLVKFGATNDYAAADVQNMFDNLRDAMMKVQEKLKDGNGISGTVAVATMPLKVVTQLLSLVNKGMDRALWDFLHDGLKLATYRMRADKTKERAKKKGWTEEELSQALDEDGQFVNDMFGGQHWDVLGASHRTLRYAGRVLLSPDWNASTTRHFLALTGYGSIWNEATFENFKQYYKRLWNKELTPEDEGRRGRQISALLCYGIGFMVFYEAFANGVNAAFRAMDEEKERKKAEEMRKTTPDYKSMYELAYGDEGMKWYDYLMRGNSLGQQSKIFLGRYADGTEMYIRHGKQFREVPEYLFNHKGELEFPGPMVQRMIGKANPMVRMTLDDINYLSDFQASHADQEIQRKYGKSIGLLYKDALYWAPFLIPSQENKEFKAVDFFFPSSKGFSPWKAQSYFKDFILSGDMEGVVMTYQSCKRNGIDAEAQIKAAIGSVKALESAEMKDGVTSLQVACQRFDAAKSITEKKKMRQKMKKFLSMSDYKAFTQKEALDMVQGYLNGEEDLKEMEKADSKYLMAAKAEDVTEDWRIQNAWNGTMEAYEEYQRLKDIDKAKANAFKNSKTNKRLFAARKAISAAKRKMNKAKKQMDGTNGAAKMVEIRKTRKELLEKLNGME